MNYKEQLLDKRWLIKRQEILERDFGMCQHCMSSKNLNVHHKKYIKNTMAWDYPNHYLITLCNSCHKKEHTSFSIQVLDKLDYWESLQFELKKKYA